MSSEVRSSASDESSKAAAVRRLRDYLDNLDETTRRLGDEEPLRAAVARQARERLAEMTDPCREPLLLPADLGRSSAGHACQQRGDTVNGATVCSTIDRCSEQHSYGPGCLLAPTADARPHLGPPCLDCGEQGVIGRHTPVGNNWEPDMHPFRPASAAASTPTPCGTCDRCPECVACHCPTGDHESPFCVACLNDGDADEWLGRQK